MEPSQDDKKEHHMKAYVSKNKVSKSTSKIKDLSKDAQQVTAQSRKILKLAASTTACNSLQRNQGHHLKLDTPMLDHLTLNKHIMSGGSSDQSQNMVSQKIMVLNNEVDTNSGSASLFKSQGAGQANPTSLVEDQTKENDMPISNDQDPFDQPESVNDALVEVRNEQAIDESANEEDSSMTNPYKDEVDYADDDEVISAFQGTGIYLPPPKEVLGENVSMRRSLSHEVSNSLSIFLNKSPIPSAKELKEEVDHHSAPHWEPLVRGLIELLKKLELHQVPSIDTERNAIVKARKHVKSLSSTWNSVFYKHKGLLEEHLKAKDEVIRIQALLQAEADNMDEIRKKQRKASDTLASAQWHLELAQENIEKTEAERLDLENHLKEMLRQFLVS